MSWSGDAAASGVEAFREGIKSNQKRRADFEDRVNAALVEESIKSRRTKSVYDIDEAGNLRSLGNVPEGAQVIRDRQLSPLDQLRQGILTNQRDIDQPGMLETRINQLGSIPGSEQQIGGLQHEYGQSVLKQQQAKAQLPMLQQQAQALQQAGLLSPSMSGMGGGFGLELEGLEDVSNLNGDTVLMQAPDGQMGSVQKGKVQGLLKKGYVLVQ